jgi:hypothetical protein
MRPIRKAVLGFCFQPGCGLPYGYEESDDEPNIYVDERWLFERGIARR